MLNILVINCGSSSLKYQLIDMDKEQIRFGGSIERIGSEKALSVYKKSRKTVKEPVTARDHHQAMELVFKILTDSKTRVIRDLDEISAVGHRVVHGGEKYSAPTVLVDETIEELEQFNYLAPLHNPQNIMGIRACKAILKETPQVAVFDTAFHQTLPAEAYIYGLPYKYYQKYGIRRYGFHGTSHRYVAEQAAELMKQPLEELKLITCHLGNGVSISAVQKGVSVENSMGFTPLEGIPMGTRCGNLDPGILLFLMEKEGLSASDAMAVLNRECGILGISELSNDFREVQKAAEKGNQQATLALKVFAYSVKKYIGAYAAVMNGIDGLVFTAGIGENSPEIRREICLGLDNLGITLDDENNKAAGRNVDIGGKESKVKILVIPTNEELMIAKEARKCIV